MIGIKVCRNPTTPGVCDENDPKLKWGPDISDALLSTDLAAKERGRIEIDTNYTNRLNVSLILSSRKYLEIRDLIGINENGVIKNGLVSSVKLILVQSGSGTFNTSTVVDIERNYS